MLFNVCSDKSYITTIQLDTANTKAAIQVLTILGQETVHVDRCSSQLLLCLI